MFDMDTGKKKSKMYLRMGEYSDGLIWFKDKKGYGFIIDKETKENHQKQHRAPHNHEMYGKPVRRLRQAFI